MTFLNFDGTLQMQDFHLSVPHEWIDCSDLSGTRGLCDPFSAREIRRRLGRRRHRGVTLIGSGNYHYVSYFLLSEIQQPFSLVLFDHHTDLALDPNGEALLSCGSWVSFALSNLSMLRRVVIVGARPSPPAASFAEQALKASRVHVVDEQTIQRAESQRRLVQTVQRAIGPWPVYVSVDKDVLRTTDAVTDWDAGSLHLGQLLYWLVWLRRHHRVVGADICGEWPTSPLDSLSSRVLTEIHKNQMANQVILQAFDCS
ncbi:arginase [Alicyclobacillus contaminans]|nr:arginase [Alicyclobacillus contaminans]